MRRVFFFFPARLLFSPPSRSKKNFVAEIEKKKNTNSLSPKQAALLSALPLALSRLGRTRARFPSATGALSAATSAVIKVLNASAAAALAAEGGKSTTSSSGNNGSSSSKSTHSFIAACQRAAEFASALPAVAQAWTENGAEGEGGRQREEEEEEEKGEREKARSLLASSLLRLLPAACLPFAPLLPPSPSAVDSLRPQTVSALRRG